MGICKGNECHADYRLVAESPHKEKREPFTTNKGLFPCPNIVAELGLNSKYTFSSKSLVMVHVTTIFPCHI